MSLATFLAGGQGKPRIGKQRRPRAATARLSVELLEDRCVPSTSGITEFPTLPTPNSQPVGVVLGPDHNYWITESVGNKIARMTAKGVVTEFQIPTTIPPMPPMDPTGSSWPISIAVGSDKNIWFTELLGNKVAKITPQGVITEYTLPHPNSQPGGNTAGPDGAMWFTERGPNAIGRITADGHITEFPIPTTVPPTRDNPTGGSDPRFIRVGSDGNLWFTELLGNKIGRITPQGVITEFPIPTTVTPWSTPMPIGTPPSFLSNPIGSSEPRGLVLGPDGNMWFTEFVGNKIGRITPEGVITEFPIATPDTHPFALAVGEDHQIWFSENTGNAIGVINTHGKFLATFAMPTANSGPHDITEGIDGTLVVAEAAGNKIAKVSLEAAERVLHHGHDHDERDGDDDLEAAERVLLGTQFNFNPEHRTDNQEPTAQFWSHKRAPRQVGDDALLALPHFEHLADAFVQGDAGLDDQPFGEWWAQ